MRPLRPRVLVLAGLLCLLAHVIAQCGLAIAQGASSDPPHVPSAQTVQVEFSPDHAHVGEGSAPSSHEEHALAALPRIENPLRLFVAAAAVVVVAMVAVPWSALVSRAPPVAAAPARRGRTVLIELCIDRC